MSTFVGDKMENESELKHEKLTVLAVEAWDFNPFVERIYGRYFCFAADQEARNGSTHSFRNIGEPLDEYDEEILKEFIETGKHNNLARVLLNDLCAKGLIESGHYIIRVFW